MYRHFILAVLFGLLLPGFLNAAIPTSDNWDENAIFYCLHGWRQNTTSTIVSGVGFGGNPNGYLRSSSAPGNPFSVIGATNGDARYTGDYQAPNIRQVDVDLNLLSGSITRIYLRFRYLDASHNGWLYEITNRLPIGVWTNFQIPFDPNWSDVDAIAAGWVQEATSASFSETMQHVYTVEIRLYSTDVENTQLGIDNFTTIGGDPTHIYTPGRYNYYLPYFKSGNGDWIGLGLANLDLEESALLQVGVYDSNGDLQAIVNKTIVAYGQDAFAVATELNGSGWMQVNSHRPLSGLAFIGSWGMPLLMADLPFISELSSCLIFPHVAQDDTWDTTISICNPNNESVSIALKYVAKDGVEQVTQTYSISAFGSGEYPLSTVFSSNIPLAGRVVINSSNGIAAFALYSDKKNGGTYYAGINAEICE